MNFRNDRCTGIVPLEQPGVSLGEFLPSMSTSRRKKNN